MKSSSHSSLVPRIRNESKTSGILKGFTLIELLVVIAIIAILAAILLPVLASAKVRAQRAQCMNNMKQVGTGILVFAGDHNDTFPFSGWSYGNAQISWSTLIYSYIGGANGQSPSSMDQGAYVNDPSDSALTGIAPGLGKILGCPLDNFPKINWMTVGGSSELLFANQDYQMVSCGDKNAQGANNLIQRDPVNGLPNITTPGFLGVGIYWESYSISRPNWNAPGLQDSVVRHPAGTIMLAEEASSQGAQGNIWPCCCCGATTADGGSGGWGNLYQIDTSAPQNPATLESGAYNEGLLLYKAQRNRFNYIFHDGHVEALMYQQTTNSNGGMWSINSGN
jgi:prepilin-type N-terminal cleavage/methylation domain-containing protein/prepilin-type processing-associated H-X9-DG protein